MAATLWERGGALGEGASTPLALPNFQNVLLLHLSGAIVLQTVQDFTGLSGDQMLEFVELLGSMPPAAGDYTARVLKLIAAFEGARVGMSEFDSGEKLRAAFIPEP